MQAERPLCSRLVYCALSVGYRSSLGEPGDELRGFCVCVCVNHCGLCGFCTTNMPLCQMESVLVRSLYGGKLVRNRTVKHFSSTHLPLTPFNLLTYINSF